MERVLCIALGYVFGLFQTGYIYGRLNGIDIRDYGSGNAGTTNALRTLGKKAGIITYAGDCLKALLCGLVIRLLFGESEPELIRALVMYGGLGVILGHNYPCYLGFKGGKGIAATSGMIVAFGDIRLSVLAFLTWLVITGLTKYVSLGSIMMMVGFIIELIVFGQLGYYGVEPPYIYEIYAVGAFLTALAIYKHRANIKRLLNGTERKLGEKAV